MFTPEILAPFHLASTANGILTLVFLAMLIGFAGITVRTILHFQTASPQANPQARDALIIHSWLWLWCAVPAGGLALAAYLVDPSRTGVRYILFATPALYLMAGVVISRVRYKPLGYALLAMLLGPFVALMHANVAINTRGGYLEAAAYMQQAPEERQWLVYRGSILTSRLVAFNADRPLGAVEEVETIEDLAEAAVAAHQQGLPAWLILEDPRNEEAPEKWRALEALLKAREVPFDRACFLGFQTIIVYGVPPMPQ